MLILQNQFLGELFSASFLEIGLEIHASPADRAATVGERHCSRDGQPLVERFLEMSDRIKGGDGRRIRGINISAVGDLLDEAHELFLRIGNFRVAV